MPFGAFRLNSLGRFTAPVVRTAKTITVSGNAQISTAQSKFGGASALFDGNGDYLTFNTSGGDFTFGTNNWTAEMWIRFDDVGANYEIFFDMRPLGSASAATVCLYEYNGALYYYSQGGDRITGGTVVANTWYHVAISRSGNDHKLFLNGTQVGSTYTNTNDITSVNANSVIGGISANNVGDPNYILKGYMDEIRVSNTARYTANFTPSTTAFTNDVNTLLLLHCNGSNATTVFTDDVGTNFIPRTPKTITASGNAQISTAQSKFGGASLLLDGTTDYIQVDSAELAVGTGDFTFECFARVVDSNNFMLFDQTNPTGSTNGLSIWLGSGGLNVYSGGWIVQTLGTIANNTWYHIAVSLDSSNNLKAFIDGTQIGSTTTFTNNINQTILRMGSARIDAGYDGNGYMDEIRVSNTARYTANFTAPTAAFTNDRDTLLLLHCNGDNTGTTFVDDIGTNEMPRTPKTITASGNAQISTAQSKFGGASALFDGTGDRLTVTSTGDFGFSGDFTLEGWFRFSSFPSQLFLFDFRLSTDGSVVKPTLYYTTSSGGSIRYFVNGADRIQSTAFASTTNTWYHIALCKSGTSTKLFINGTQDGSTYTDTNTYVDSNCAIGDYAGGGYGFNGYADEIRFSNTARYTANFTAPTAAFSNDRDTLLLIHCNGTNTQTTFFDDNIWANTVGNTYFTPPSAEFNSDGSTIALWHLNSALTDSGPSALTLSTSGGYNTTTKKFGTASGDLSDSTTDFFARATTGHYWIYGGTSATGARQYTIEFWTYNTVFTNNSETDGGGYQLPLTFVTAAAGVGLTTTGKMTQNQYPGPRGSTTGVDVGADTAPTSQWVHQAYVIGNDMKWRGYLDGKLQFIQTAIDPSSIYTTATDIQIGRNSSSGTNANLMIDEIRLSSTKRYGS